MPHITAHSFRLMLYYVSVINEYIHVDTSIANECLPVFTIRKPCHIYQTRYGTEKRKTKQFLIFSRGDLYT